MGKKRRSKHRTYLEENIIREACNGDNEAISIVIMHYWDYVKIWIRKYSDQMGLHLSEDNVDDVVQMVWERYIHDRLSLFTDRD